MTASCLSPLPLSTGPTGLLQAAFRLFNGQRIVAYLPTLFALQSAGQADQHSLLPWFVLLGANATMGLWLHESNGRRVNQAVLVSAVNALMCGAVALAIVWQRWGQSLF